MEEICYGCTCEIKMGVSERRKLYSKATCHLLPIITSKFREIYSSDDVEKLLPSMESEGCKEPDIYICMRCFRSLRRLSNLETERKEIDKSLKAGIVKVGEWAKLQPKSEVSTPTRTKKRPRETTPPAASPSKRRRGPDTPTRNIVQRIHAPGTPSVSVIVKKQNKARVFQLSHSLKSLGRSVGRRNRSSIARQVVKDSRIRKKVVERMGKLLSKELTNLASLKTNSILRNRSCEALEQFSWRDLLVELEKETPITISLLKQCAYVKRRVYKPRGEGGRSSRRMPNEEAAVGMCIAILMRARSQRMNLVQRLISILLYGSHAPKQLYRQLNRLLLCLSNKQTLSLVDKMGRSHDQVVLQWRDDICTRKLGTTVTISQPEKDNGTTLLPATQPLTQPISESKSATKDPTQSLDDQRTSSSSSSESVSENGNGEDEESSEATINNGASSSSSSYSFGSSFEEDILHIFGPECSFAPTPSSMKTYKLTGDNLDKNIKPTEYRVDSQTKSLHYFQTYAVRDRIDLTSYDDTPPVLDESSISTKSLLPSESDYKQLTKNFTHHVARILKEYMPFFSSFGSGLERHIRHQYYEEMSQKSEIVPLGILLKNESKYEDMVDIMESLHAYVPTHSTISKETVPSDNEEVDVMKDKFHQILFGGDQLTVARARGSQRIRKNSERGKERLEGLTPVCEDWHTKLCLLGVIWRRLYSGSSVMDGGTMYQLRNLVNRRNVVSDPKDNEAACEDFMITVTDAHVLACAMELFEMDTLTDRPSKKFFPDGSSELDSLQRRNILLLAAEQLVKKYVDLSIPEEKPKKKKQKQKPKKKSTAPKPPHDGIYEYAKDTLTLGLLLKEYIDAVREGDGDRIICVWKFLLPLFKSTGRTNYSLEAFTLLAQYFYLFSPRMAAQLAWSRTVNTHGRPGKNISCDLHLEHLNREVKNVFGGLSSNITEQSVKRIGKSIKGLSNVTHCFDDVNHVPTPSGHHTRKPKNKDVKMMLEQLRKAEVFRFHNGRNHKTFPNFIGNACKAVNQEALKEWMDGQMKKLLSQSC